MFSDVEVVGWVVYNGVGYVIDAVFIGWYKPTVHVETLLWFVFEGE